MQIRPYIPAYAVKVKNMLKSHVDYAPETTDSACHDNILFFEDTFVENNEGLNAYVVHDEKDEIISFMVVHQKIISKKVLLYIIALFVAKKETASQYALNSVCLFQNMLDDSTRLAININPQNEEIVTFWQTNGFDYKPEISLFVNADNERLCAYENISAKMQ